MATIAITSEDILVTYKSKIEEAIQLLLHIPPQYKAEAWQFWQIVTQTVKLFTQSCIDEATPFAPPSDVLVDQQAPVPAPFFSTPGISPIKVLPSPKTKSKKKSNSTKENKSSQSKKKSKDKKKVSKKPSVKKEAEKKTGKKDNGKTSSKGSPGKPVTTENEAEVAAQTLTDAYTTVFTPISTLDFSDLISNPNSVQSVHLHYEESSEVMVKPVILLPQDEQIIAAGSVRTVSSQGDVEEDGDDALEASDVVSQEILIENVEMPVSDKNQKENKRPKRIRYKRNMRVKRTQTDPDVDPIAISKKEKLKEEKLQKLKEEKEKKQKRKSIKKQGFLYEGHSYSKVPDEVLETVDEEDYNGGDDPGQEEEPVQVILTPGRKTRKRKVKVKKEAVEDQEFEALSFPLPKKCRRKRRTKEEMSKATYDCKTCGITLSSQGALDVHTRSHTGERPFQCSMCPDTFTTKGNLQRHEKYHQGIKPFTCEICDTKFTEKKSLKVHMRIHTGEKPFKCERCDKAFSQSGPLQAHLRIHEGVKPHQCDVCGKGFRTRMNLVLHKRRHHEVKIFKCGEEDCTMTFCTKMELQRHLAAHSKLKDYMCNICNKTYSRFQYLKEHMNSHTGETPFVCLYCPEKFKDHGSFHKHKVKQHGDQIEIRSRKLERVPIVNLEDHISQSLKKEGGVEQVKENSTATSTPDNNEMSTSDNVNMSTSDNNDVSTAQNNSEVLFSSAGGIQMSTLTTQNEDGEVETVLHVILNEWKVID
ncbi:zinc finger protein 892-like [Saccostrea cucullata]|uniref:zinc finger protein 892-like n=1 Tax=Saccostrea cuccullata TaxID=36930 RepID=UPI002ED65BE3